MISVALFNNKGGVGETALAYHLAWTFANLGYRTLAVDLDPQANLSSLFLDADELEVLWPDGAHPDTLLGAVQPILDGVGDIAPARVVELDPPFGDLGLLVGDLGLSAFEAKLADAWPRVLDQDLAALRATTAFYRTLERAGASFGAELAIIDVGPNLGAINRAALLAADFVVVPLAPDLFSIQGLRNLGPTLSQWRAQWAQRLAAWPEGALSQAQVAVPTAPMRPAGYVVQQLALRRQGQSPEAYERWSRRIPAVYRKAVLGQEGGSAPDVADDPECLARVKHYRSLMLMAMEARKPVFALRPADGAMGSHARAVQDCRKEFDALAQTLARRVGVRR